MKILMTLLLVVAFASPVAFARRGGEDVATATARTQPASPAVTAAIVGENPKKCDGHGDAVGRHSETAVTASASEYLSPGARDQGVK